MSRRLFGAAVLAAAIVGIPLGDAFAQKDKKKGDKAEVAAPIDAAKLGAGEFVGVLKSTPGTDRTFTLECEQTKLVPNKAGKGGGNPKGGGNNPANRVIQLQNQLQQAQTQYATARTAQQKQQAAGRVRQYTGQLQQAMAQLQAGGAKGGGAPAGFHYEKSKVSVEFQVSEKAKIRTAILPEAFDDKGNIKKYTSKELADLKGKNKALPGYESSIEKLEVGQTVKVTQSVAPKDPPKESAKDAPAKDMDKDDDVKADKSKQVKLIVILTEAAPSAAGKDRPKKKN